MFGFNLYCNWNSIEGSYIGLNYPSNTLECGSPYFEVNTLFGRVKQMEFSKYNILQVEMKRVVGGETFEVGVKDKYDVRNRTSARLKRWP